MLTYGEVIKKGGRLGNPSSKFKKGREMWSKLKSRLGIEQQVQSNLNCHAHVPCLLSLFPILRKLTL